LAELAKDPEIDLVVCSVRVDRHLATISPSLKAGKDVYVEWPLGKSLAEAKELLKLKNEGGVKKAVVGLQARQAPLIKKVKELIQQGRIGEVYSSTWVGQGSVGGETTGMWYGCGLLVRAIEVFLCSGSAFRGAKSWKAVVFLVYFLRRQR
jgi:predicted dehydrogenase